MKQTSRISLLMVPWWCLWCVVGCQALVNRAGSSWNGYNFYTYPHPANPTMVPRDIMVDVNNRLGLDLLAHHNEYNENNIAISPYGALSVLTTLGEGLQGDAVREIQHAAHIPNDISIIRVGLRDIHRHLKSYFIPREGFLAGLTLNHENVTLRPEYEEILKFYGYDTPTFNNALYPGPLPTEKPSLTIIPETTSDNPPSATPLSITTAVPLSSEEKTTVTTTEVVSTVSGDARELDKVTETLTQFAITTTPESIMTLQPAFMIATTKEPPAATTLEPVVITTTTETTSMAPEITSSITTPQAEVTSGLAETNPEPATTTKNATTSWEHATIESEPVTTTTVSSSTALEPEGTETLPNKPEPAKTTQELLTTTLIPVTTAQQPVTAEQLTTTQVSVTTISEPATTTSEPSTTTSEPPTTTSEPLATTSVPVTITLEPLATTLEPLPTTSESPTTNPGPITTTKTTVTLQDLPSDAPVPETTTLSPSVTTLEQVITTLQPMITQPDITELEPATTEPEAVTTTLDSIITTPEPIAMTTGTVSTTLEPVVMTTEPVSTTVEPAAVTTSEPVITTLESLVTTLGPVTTNASATTIEELVNTPLEEETSTLAPTTTSLAVAEPKTVVVVEDESEPTSTEAVTTIESEGSEEIQANSASATTLILNEPTETTQESNIDNEILTNDVENSGLGFAGSSKRRARSQFNVIELNRWRGKHATTPKRQIRSVVDYVMARHYDDHHSLVNFQRPFVGEEQPSFLVHGKYREYRINFMKYDTVLPFVYVVYLDAVALSFPLDSSKYYLLLLLPRDENGVDKLICDLRRNGSLRPIVENLRYGRVVATIPSFSLKGYVTLTPTFQQLGIKKVFEPRQSDFSPMTDQEGIFVKNIEQAITVNIKNYVDPNNLVTNRRLEQDGPMEFKADHPFLYFVMDSELHIVLMEGKIVNPLNSRIR